MLLLRPMTPFDCCPASVATGPPLYGVCKGVVEVVVLMGPMVVPLPFGVSRVVELGLSLSFWACLVFLFIAH